MSRLRNLYFADNTLDDLDASLMVRYTYSSILFFFVEFLYLRVWCGLQVLQKPIDAPLQQLNIAKCGLKNVPDFGILPSNDLH